eukprot:g31820.t1
MEDTVVCQKFKNPGSRAECSVHHQEENSVDPKGLILDKSSRPDGPHPRVQKEIAEEIVDALVVIFQEPRELGRVPMVNVILLFKKKVSKNLGNYRPAILTSVIGKILESIIKDEIAEYMEVYEVEIFVGGCTIFTNICDSTNTEAHLSTIYM